MSGYRDSIRGLGARQRGAIKCLLTIGPFPGGGWYSSTHGQTIKILESLVRRGLVEKVQAGMKRDDPRRRSGLMEPLPHDRYQLTTDGKLFAEEFAGKRTATCVCGSQLVRSPLTGYWWHSNTDDPKLLASEPHEPRPS